MKKHWLYLILGLALILNSSCTVNAQDEGGWWDVSSETDVTIDETLETKPTESAESSEEAKDTEKSEEAENKEEKQVITYTVVPGDTLCSIALRYLGSASRYPEIVALNPELISDPNVILTGWNLKIQLDGAAPATEEAAADPEPEVEVTDESSESGEVEVEPVEEKTNAEKLAELQRILDEANSKLPAGFGLVDFNGTTVKYLVENGIITKEELAALSPEDGYSWRINNGKMELVDAKNVALTPEDIAALDAANAAKKNGEEDSEEKKGVFQTIGEKIDNGIRKVGEGIQKVGEGVKKGVEKVGEGVKKGVEKVGEGIKKGVETVGKGIKTFGNWLSDRIEYNRVTRVARAQNSLDTLVTAAKVVTTPARAIGSGLVSGLKGFFVGGEDSGFVNGAKKVFSDTIESVTGLHGRCQERIDNALENANYGGSTIHTSSNGSKHGGSGGHF